ncbi:uncharacterized protein LOC112561028 isoform X1 [Pomacea canaliculata]|uniref:uncharacterized protein LOC112561028 isoform X1 n=1 Tax=Pomacea canaliculata TaxID=400727 RepID=UPI000D72663F|nr:uncharacterized protein LOC112561028 isoform X1 [Pomacea canaliculata]
MDSLDQILQDVEEDLFVDFENDVCGKIPHDKNIKDKNLCLECSSWKDVLNCLRPVSRNTARKKVWTKFHMAMKDQDNLRSLNEMVTSAVSPWLCFEALNIMISTVFDKFFKTEIKYTEKGNQSLNDIEKNITHYIGGAVLQKNQEKNLQI